METYRYLESQQHHFSSYHSLHHLSVNVTAGTWDWDGRGSPQWGASDAFIFKNLGFPALSEFELQVSDLTIHAERPGPMELVHWETLKYLRLTVVHWCVSNNPIHQALPITIKYLPASCGSRCATSHYSRRFLHIDFPLYLPCRLMMKHGTGQYGDGRMPL